MSHGIFSYEYLRGWLVAIQGTNALVAAGIILGTGILSSFVRGQILKSHLGSKRKKKLSECQKALHKVEQESTDMINPGLKILSTKDLLILKQGRFFLITSEAGAERQNILELTLEQLIRKLQSGSLTPSQALLAYQSKAIEVHKKLNCLVEPIVEAKTQAKTLEQSKQKQGPLFGVPVSVKDNFGIKGYDCCVGCSRFIDKPFHADSVVVQLLKEQGAVPFVKTNVPQTMISWETTNPVFGPTKNPQDTSRGVGGSSGGEAALVGGGGSVLGFGSDIGGSIRIPSNMCGVYGLKPTELRISNVGTAPIMRGQTCLGAVYGPIANDVQSLAIAMKALCVPRMSELDPLVPYLPFNTEVYESKRKLKIGYFLQDGYFHAVPAMERGVLLAKAALEKMGHQVVPWDFKDLGDRVVHVWGNAIMGDGGRELKELLRGDAIDSSMQSVVQLMSVPVCIRKLLYHVIRHIYPAMAAPLKASIGLGTVTNWWNLMAETNEFRREVASDWRDQGFDAVLCPGFGCPAIQIGQSRFATGAASYTMLYNVLNFPAGSLPVTKVTDEDNKKLKQYPLKDIWHRVVKKCLTGSEGLSVNVQVASLPWQEEMVLRVMKDLEASLHK